MVKILELVSTDEIDLNFFSIYNPNCLTLDDKFGYWDDRLASEDLNRVETHVSQCTKCFDELYGPKQHYIEINQKLKQNEQRSQKDF
jgi:hypothetical protein